MAELNLDSIKDMKKAVYKKLFLKPAVWKKAKAVMILVDYKLDKKKSVVVLPYKKEAEMNIEFKKLKADKLHLVKKTGGGKVNLTKGDDGKITVTVDLTKGGLAAGLAKEKLMPAFKALKMNVDVVGAGEEESSGLASVTSAVESVTSTLTGVVDDVVETVTDAFSKSDELIDDAKQAIEMLKSELIPNHKNNGISKEDAPMIEDIKSTLLNFNNKFGEMSEELQSQYAKLKAQVKKALPAVDKILDAAFGTADGSGAKELIDLIKEISKGTKGIKKTAVTNLKKDKVTDDDINSVKDILGKVDSLGALFSNAADNIKERIESEYEKVSKMVGPQMKKLLKKLEGSKADAKGGPKEDSALQKILDDAKAMLAKLKGEVVKIGKDIDKSPKTSSTLPSGTALLD